MAGALTISTLKDSSGVLATQNGMTGIAKAWINYNGVANTITGSFNVSSVTRNAAGDYTINFTTSMADANYAVTGSAGQAQGDGTGISCGVIGLKCTTDQSGPAALKTTSQVSVMSRYQNANYGQQYDFQQLSIAILGN
jgi:hypothetical protein